MKPDSGLASDLAAAYAWCERLAREHYENFPVASRLLPARMRPHIAAIYAFARIADDFADEPGRADADRLQLLAEWEAGLAWGSDTGQTRVRLESDPCPILDHTTRTTVFTALHHTIQECGLPRQLFHDLISAFRQDVTVTRYESWDDVLDYCRRSANPVGRLVLRVAGYDDPRLDAASDALCTALQLTNFWQDLERDWQNGRLYVPAEAHRAYGADLADLDERRWTESWRKTLAACGAKTRALFAGGRPACDGVTGRLRWELRLTWLGGSRILDKLEAARFDVFGQRPTLGAADAPAILGRLLRWRVTPP